MKLRKTNKGNIKLTLSEAEAQHVTAVLGMVITGSEGPTYEIFDQLDDLVGSPFWRQYNGTITFNGK